MMKQSTNELEQILSGVHEKNISKYLEENKGSLVTGERPFSVYVKERIRERRLRLYTVFIQADIPERYGYKLLSEEKRTRQRDVILRICFAAQFTLVETQRALKLYGLSPLYARVPRDAVLMVAFREGLHSVLEVNEILEKHQMEILGRSGAQD